jgi:hypothetical protein
MTEKILTLKQIQEQEDNERLADYLSRHVPPVNSAPNLIGAESEPGIRKFQALMDAAEDEFPLGKLEAIVELSPDLAMLFKYANELSDNKILSNIKVYEAHNPSYVRVYREKMAHVKSIILSRDDNDKYIFRTGAIKARARILEALNAIPKTAKEYEELKKRYLRFGRAIGGLNGTRINHS